MAHSAAQQFLYDISFHDTPAHKVGQVMELRTESIVYI